MRARTLATLYRRIPWAFALAALALSGISAPALGSTWTGRQLSGEAATVMMFGISCPTSSLCVAVGGNNTIATSTNPAGGVASWDVVYAGEGAIATGPATFGGRQVRGVSCPSPQLCVAVTFDGFIYTSANPTGGANAWSVADLDGSAGPSTHLYGVSCPSASFCAASAGKGRIVTSTNPTGGAAAWSIAQLEGPLELRGISCASPSLCVAVGDDGDDARPADSNNGEIAVSTTPLGGVWQRLQMPAAGSLFGVSCPSPSLCVSGDRFGNLLASTDPIGAPSAWRRTDGGGTTQLTAFDCLSASRCIAVDNNGDVLTSTNPSGGPGAWTFANVLPYPQLDETASNHMSGVSCPSISFCAIAVNHGQILTSEDPFAESPAPVKKKGKKRHRRGPKRPRTNIGRQPFPEVELKGRKLTVRFGFYAMHHVPVRGFVCKIDKRPMKRCRSPKAYRVGAGRHHFRVRAIGWSGRKGPPALAWFRACRPPSPPPPSPRPPCWR